jgi:cation diffusion facilitator CzcD-associated flavoprotein CzcO
MLQRSPTYIATLPSHDRLAAALRRRLPAKAVYAIVRWKNVGRMMLSYQLSRRAPKLMRKLLRKGVEAQLPDGYDIDTDFEPRYDPWDERLCLVPGGDLFRALRGGRAEIVTDQIETFTERGLRLRSGRELEADVVVTATGLNLLILGGIELVVDSEPVEISATVGYKGMMFAGVPNMAIALGYTNASWTLKCDLVAEYVCRLLAHMDANGQRVAVPRAPDPGQPTEAFIDLKSGYVLRSLHQLPKQGATHPWRLHQNYPRDIRLLKHGPVDDQIDFSPGPVAAPAPQPVAA